MIRYTVCHTDDSEDIIAELDRQLIGSDPVAATDEAWLVSRNDGVSVGYATGKIWPPDNYFYFTRCGVLPEARRNGLQRRLIRARLKWAKRHGCAGAYTYTLPANVGSANNLIATGFRLWRPAYKWAGADALYWCKEFSK